MSGGLTGQNSDASVSDAPTDATGPADASTADSSDSSDSFVGGEPTVLSAAGLYADIVRGTLAPGVYPYHPQFVLWADGATKNRYVKLPAGSQIDTTDMDFWEYPVGTKLFKEFSLNGVRLETRMILKRGVDDFYYVAFQWNGMQTEAIAVPNGVVNASGTTHDIPSQNDCQTCHENMHDRILGFSAVQLAHPLTGPTDPEVNLQKIASMGWLTSPPPPAITIPGDSAAQAALGYLHANCGNCHNPKSFVYLQTVTMDMWLQTDRGQLSSVPSTPTYQTLVGQPSTTMAGAQMMRIFPGQPSLSAVHQLMSLRESSGNTDGSAAMRQMPPLATKIVDATGLAQVDAWIHELPATGTDAGPDQ
jgi:hypothetical protein